jgi:hypothetical protein
MAMKQTIMESMGIHQKRTLLPLFRNAFHWRLNRGLERAGHALHTLGSYVPSMA